MWRCAGLVAVAACGRVDFGSIDVEAPLPSLIQTTAVLATPPQAPVISIVPTRAGDLLVVGTANIDNNTPIVSIGDDAGNPYTSANATYTESCCIGEFWYAADIAAGAKQLTIVDSSPVRREIWLLELANVNALAGASEISSATATSDTVTAPLVSTSSLPELVMSMIDTGSVDSLENGFFALPDLNADGAAFAIAVIPGAYAPTWSVGGTNPEYASATVAFAAE